LDTIDDFGEYYSMMAHFPPDNNEGVQNRIPDPREHCRRRAIMRQYDSQSHPDHLPPPDECCDICSLGVFTGDSTARENAISDLIKSKIRAVYSIPNGFRRPKVVRLGVSTAKKVSPRKPKKLTAAIEAKRKGLRNALQLAIIKIRESDPELMRCPITWIMTVKQIDSILNGGDRCREFSYLSKLLSQKLKRPFAHVQQIHEAIKSFYLWGLRDIGSPYPEVMKRVQQVHVNPGTMSGMAMREKAIQTRNLQLAQEAANIKIKNGNKGIHSDAPVKVLTENEQVLFDKDQETRQALSLQDCGKKSGDASDLAMQWKLLMLTWPHDNRIEVPTGVTIAVLKKNLLALTHPLTGKAYTRIRMPRKSSDGVVVDGDK